MKTYDKIDLLSKQIMEANVFARGEEIIIYINPSDESLKASLESKTGFTLTISATDFIGGTKAVIKTKNILIDNSFLTKLTEAKDDFHSF
jgi:vacuolar-type H+-ATPase subunit E/Vma4